MAKLTVLWHLHQPMYRTADNRVHAPWVLLHAAGEYLTLTRVLERTGWQGQVLNLVPVFIEQLAAYRDGVARDPLLEALRAPARELAPAG
jgi:alpha-amylase/alpha-mannosidase (GH57 family)